MKIRCRVFSRATPSSSMERCVAKRLVPHVAAVLHSSQHGFQEGKLCVTQLLEAFHSIGKSLDKGTETDIVYLDFAKAFDSVYHARLLAKLRSFGITSPLLDWFRAYLSDRRQRVVINGTHSSWTRVGSGVPQGSILGPILFLLYINDMPEVVRDSLIVMFADDAKCFKVIDSLTDCIVFQNDLDSLSVSSMRNELLFQPPKCHNLRISRKRNSFHRNYYLSGQELEIVAKERDLGVIVCKDINWAEHLTAIVSKANRMLGFLKRNCAGILDSKALKLLYLSLVRSHLSYFSQVWAPQSIIKDILLIESVPRRATRFICKNNELSYREVSFLFQMYAWLGETQY